MTDDDLVNEIVDLDKSDVTLNKWEINFIDDVILLPRKRKQRITFSEKQRIKLLEIIDKYADDLD